MTRTVTIIVKNSNRNMAFSSIITKKVGLCRVGDRSGSVDFLLNSFLTFPLLLYHDTCIVFSKIKLPLVNYIHRKETVQS